MAGSNNLSYLNKNLAIDFPKTPPTHSTQQAALVSTASLYHTVAQPVRVDSCYCVLNSESLLPTNWEVLNPTQCYFKPGTGLKYIIIEDQDKKTIEQNVFLVFGSLCNIWFGWLAIQL